MSDRAKAEQLADDDIANGELRPEDRDAAVDMWVRWLKQLQDRETIRRSPRNWR